MTTREYKILVKTLIGELEKCKDEIFEQQQEVEYWKAEYKRACAERDARDKRTDGDEE